MKNPASSPTVSIADSALATITHEALRSLDGRETGGILLGTDTPEGIVILHAGDAGPNAHRGERTFLRDLDHARRVAESAWKEDRSQWIGEWHTHPPGGLAPSDLDLHSYLRHLQDPELGLDQFVAVIAGLDEKARIIIATWIIELHHARPVPLVRHKDGSPDNGNPTPDLEEVP